MTHVRDNSSTADFLIPEGFPPGGCSEVKKVGDVVMLGQDSPYYEIVHISGDIAWIENKRERHFVSIDRLRKVN